MRLMEDEDCMPDVRVLRQGQCVARTYHTCAECPYDRQIPPGVRYARSVYLLDGKFTVQATCLSSTCWPEYEAACEARRKADLGQPLGPGELAF